MVADLVGEAGQVEVVGRDGGTLEESPSPSPMVQEGDPLHCVQCSRSDLGFDSERKRGGFVPPVQG